MAETPAPTPTPTIEEAKVVRFCPECGTKLNKQVAHFVQFVALNFNLNIFFILFLENNNIEN